MIYLDSSALLKLVFEEPQSAALESWLSERTGTPVVSSELARVEVIRAARRLDERALPAARTLLSELDLVPLGGSILIAAADLADPLLRTLDAIHLASALRLGADLTAFVAYDRRLIAAAATAGIDAMAPVPPS